MPPPIRGALAHLYEHEGSVVYDSLRTHMNGMKNLSEEIVQINNP